MQRKASRTSRLLKALSLESLEGTALSGDGVSSPGSGQLEAIELSEAMGAHQALDADGASHGAPDVGSPKQGAQVGRGAARGIPDIPVPGGSAGPPSGAVPWAGLGAGAQASQVVGAGAQASQEVGVGVQVVREGAVSALVGSGTDTPPPPRRARRAESSSYVRLPEEDVFAPGTLLEGKFEIQHKIGQGAMGTVYLATDVTLKRKVAVKTLASTFHDPELIAQFRGEAESMARVQHPNVVQVFSYGEEAGVPYFTMEFVDGETLAEAIDRREMAGEYVHLDEAVGIISQVCRGLSAIHARGIVHRDVKPANIMITSTYRVALTDFGLVGRIADETNKGMEVHGTPVYLAPERIDTKPVPAEWAHSCDLYALGVVLYEFLTHAVPFEHEDVTTLLTMHLLDPPPPPSRFRPDLPPAVDEFILRALAKDPAHRFASAEEFRRELLAARDAGAGQAPAVLEDLTVLVVHSDVEATLRVVRAVKKAFPGATVLTAADGRRGLAFLERARPELLVLDEAAEDLNALEFLASCSEAGTAQQTRVLVITHQADRLEQQYLRDLGACEVLEAPVASEALVRALRSARSGV